jgi:hypothetical protein
MSNPEDILGMAAHLNGDTFLKRLSEKQMDYLREYLAGKIEREFGKKASEQAVDLAVLMYARGVDDAGGAFIVMWKIYQARLRAVGATNN